MRLSERFSTASCRGLCWFRQMDHPALTVRITASRSMGVRNRSKPPHRTSSSQRFLSELRDRRTTQGRGDSREKTRDSLAPTPLRQFAFVQDDRERLLLLAGDGRRRRVRDHQLPPGIAEYPLESIPARPLAHDRQCPRTQRRQRPGQASSAIGPICAAPRRLPGTGRPLSPWKPSFTRTIPA